ncbi:MAG: mobile mystery protein A [Ignavibacteriales bacterium]|nr:mobile mystery protein A [Ignavibacteriales bacterium]
MNNDNRRLLLEQLDRKLESFTPVRNLEVPSEGWIKTVRTALNMSLAQLARRMKKTPATVKEMETREKDGGITLNKLAEAADALECRVFYTFIPKERTFDDIIEQRALKLAKEIIIRTSQTMELENQANNSERNRNALLQRKERIKYEMPRSLWD